MWCSLRSAFAFLSRIPVGPWALSSDLSGITRWLPVVGAVIGGLVGIFLWGSSQLFSPLLAGVLTCAFWVMLTGGLHLDGVADCGDGMIPEVSQEKRLDIMKDSRLGTFGGIALFFTLVLKIATLTHLSQIGGVWGMLIPCFMAGVLSRAQLFLVMRAPSARPGGLGEAFKQGTCSCDVLYAAWVVIFVVILGGVFLGFSAIMALVVALLGSRILVSYALKRLGGVTGDVFGLTVETVEWLVLLTFCVSG